MQKYEIESFLPHQHLILQYSRVRGVASLYELVMVELENASPTPVRLEGVCLGLWSRYGTGLFS